MLALPCCQTRAVSTQSAARASVVGPQEERHRKLAAIEARKRAQDEENRRLAAERKRKMDELQHKVRFGGC